LTAGDAAAARSGAGEAIQNLIDTGVSRDVLAGGIALKDAGDNFIGALDELGRQKLCELSFMP
jgi:hypothetical protein